MSRRYPRRAAAAALARNLLMESEDEFSSDNEIDFLHIVRAVIQSSRRRTPRKRAPKKSKSPKTTTSAKRNTRGGRRGQQTIAPSTLTAAVNLESDNEHIDEEVKVNQLKNIENKVDNFFKSGNLLSDDDDDLDIVKSDVKQPPKESKEFYSLSDSDDDKPSTSKLNSDHMSSPEGPAVIDKIDIAEQSKTKGDDELMEIVDKILDGNEDPIEIDVEPDQSWAEYKSKTEEILGSMNAILDEFKENVEEKKPEEKVVEKSPPKAKTTCPICLEVLGTEVVAAATLCGHIFCLGCIQKVAKTTKTCPTCRKRINLKQIHPIYL